MSKIWITSDSHFNHTNITGPKVSKWSSGFRNFDSVEEMNDCIIDAYNSKVQPDDILIHGGDFAFGDKKQIPALRNRIKCKTIHLIYGNHDEAIRSNVFFQGVFTSVQDYMEFRHKGTMVCVMHYPMYVWNEHARGAIHLFGHCHGNLGQQTRKREDVGFDPHREILSLEDYFDLMQGRVVEMVDHHTKETNYG